MKVLKEGSLLGIGNPLLDIIVQADEALLQKYQLLPNNAIIAEDAHIPLFAEITSNGFKPEYVAGGSAQNTMRVCQWLLNKPNVCIYMGSVGCDKYSDILAKKAKEAGVLVKYQYQENYPTGTCAALVLGNNRSLCANLAAANHFTLDHIEKPENQALIENVDYFYIGGFFLTVSPESALRIAQQGSERGKIVSINLSAEFICRLYTKPLLDLMPFIDILFGNETEAAALAESLQFKTKDLREIVLKLSQLGNRNRLVVITQGHLPVVIGNEGKICEVEIGVVPKEKIVDTTGAGDAFVGGFLSQYMQDKSIEESVKCGIWAAAHIISQSGCTFDQNLSYPL